MPWIPKELSRPFRYVLVGSINTLGAYLVFTGCLALGWHYALATLAGGVFGVVSGFRLHGRFVFGGRGRFAPFVLVFLLTYALSVGIQAASRRVVSGYLAGAIATFITVPTSFYFNRTLVFRPDLPGSTPQDGQASTPKRCG